MSSEPEASRPAPGAVPPAPVDTLVDRAARNPFYRYLMYFGLPLSVSLLVHVGLLAFLALKTFTVLSRPMIEVGEYNAGLTESLADRMKDAFQWSDAAAPDTPEESQPDQSFDSLTNLPDVPDTNLRELRPPDAGSGLGTGDGLGIGDGALTLLGTGGGAGEPGTGGFGSGLGSGAGLGQAGLWGLKIRANKIVYVVDFSGSIMVAADALKRELRRSVGELQPTQSFDVIIFYTTGGGVDEHNRTESFKPQLEPAIEPTRREFFDWIKKKAPRGETQPLEAIQRALALHPDAIFFHSDGYFDDAIVGEIERANRKQRAKIHCIVFDDILLQDTSGLPRDTEGSRRLQKIADANGGKLQIVTGKDLKR
jgi:hypothetical protein